MLLQQTVTGGDYGHAAIVCNSLWDEAKMGPKGECDVLIFESFSSHHGNFVLDALSNEIRSGTQAHVLHRRLDAMEDTVVCHPLKEPLDSEELKALKAFLTKVHDEKAEYDYDQVPQITLHPLLQLDDSVLCGSPTRFPSAKGEVSARPPSKTITKGSSVRSSWQRHSKHVGGFLKT